MKLTIVLILIINKVKSNDESDFTMTNSQLKVPLERMSFNGPKVLPDEKFLEKLGHFVRERTLLRTGFSHGTGAFGHFKCGPNSLTKYTKANLFNQVGKQTRVIVRFGFSLLAPGASETSKANIGYAMTIRFYTDDGNFDIFGVTNPAIIRDSLRIVSALRSQAANVNSFADLNSKWEMISLVPEILTTAIDSKESRSFPHSLTMLKTTTSQTLKLVNDRGEHTFVRFLLEPVIKFRYLEDKTILDLASRMPDYYSRELFTAIKRGRYPEWELRAQIISPKIVKKLKFNPFDPTKVWDESIIPSMLVGKLILNENPSNFFSQIEQLAFNPLNLVTGIEINYNDQVLQSRSRAYLDAQLHRLGSNFAELPMNKPISPNTPQIRDGNCANRKNGGIDQSYFPNSFGLTGDSPRDYSSSGNILGPIKIKRYNTVNEDNYSQLNESWNSWSQSERNLIVKRLWAEFSRLERFIQNDALKQIKLINIEFYEKFLPLLENAQ
ncbi:catalase-like [Brevipalpus obovatus]|uniref:catalase-like n=1 Tax=Brevipalpus obovatus TaxID=246614 RepID=UPI003D9E9395